MTRFSRRLGFGLAAVAVGLLAAAAPAAAAETTGGCVFEEIQKAEERYGSLHALEEGDKSDLEKFEDDLEKCVEAPSLILPELDEIIWGGGAFLILLVFMVWKGVPAVKGVMDARAERIRADLDAADEAKAAARRTQSEYEAQLADAKAAAARLIDEARTQADELKVELQSRAEAEIVEQRARAAADIEAGRSQAISDLRSDVSAIAVAAAERVVGASLDAAVHQHLIDQYIDEVAGSNG